MPIVYCNSSNLGILLKEINRGLKVGEDVKLKIKLDKGISFYYGYFILNGFEIKDFIKKKGKITIDIIKNKSIKSIKSKKYSWLIKLPRTGKDGKRIFVYKFRTMEPYSEYIQDFIIKKNGLNEDGTIRNDFRITKVGKFLRRYWLDELPMLFNLFNGDLKLIGFRPLSDTMLNQYPKEFIPLRNRYKPGLIPPYYVDAPNSFEGVIDSEKLYIKSYSQNALRTDTSYFFKFLKVIFLKGTRSS
ncbi:Undecaprenyl-phosphate galactosephosphotransferase [hydrothermal vent metagenome]|uniref:Undecaprenyl-phosphate galactosephosphotransferase n=1 Tax=hydrothermal vent metagenome TaxID=652676 RepID=A0A1W1CY62_9ZZZZ